jgi:hypothetical protein
MAWQSETLWLQVVIPYLLDSFSACPAKRLALQADEMGGPLAATGQGGNRIIEILSAINCRFLGPNSR